MKKFIIFTAVFMIMMLIFCTTPSFAKDVGPYGWPGSVEDKAEQTTSQRSNIYVGIGGSYAYENFEVDSDVSNFLEYMGASKNFDDTNGINLKVGYHVNNVLSLEFNIDHLPGFDWDYNYFGIISADAKIDITTYMVAAKISPDFNLRNESIKPFVVGGFGVMRNNLDVNGSIFGNSASASDSDTSICFKIGTGVDLFVTENVSVGFEVSYVVGNGSLEILGQEIIDEIRYTNCTVGVAYHF